MKLVRKDYAAEIRRKVREYGFGSTHVMADETPGFCYSTGIFETFGIPELFISALPSGLSAELIRAYVERFTSRAPPLGERISRRDERFDYYLIPASLEALGEYVLASFKYYQGRPFEYLQLVYPDVQQRFPHEPGYDYDQVIVGDYSRINLAYRGS